MFSQKNTRETKVYTPLKIQYAIQVRLHNFFCSNVRCFLSRFILDVTAYTSKRSVTHVLHIKIYPFFLLDLQKSDRFLVVPCHVGIQFSLDAHPFIFLHFL